MKPSLPHRWFDLLFIPQHDRHRRAANVIETRGVICPTTDAPKDPGQGLTLLCGENPHFVWSNNDIATQIAAIARASPPGRGTCAVLRAGRMNRVAQPRSAS